MISWVAMDRIAERHRSADAAYRKLAAGKAQKRNCRIQDYGARIRNGAGPRFLCPESKDNSFMGRPFASDSIRFRYTPVTFHAVAATDGGKDVGLRKVDKRQMPPLRIIQVDQWPGKLALSSNWVHPSNQPIAQGFLPACASIMGGFRNG